MSESGSATCCVSSAIDVLPPEGGQLTAYVAESAESVHGFGALSG